MEKPAARKLTRSSTIRLFPYLLLFSLLFHVSFAAAKPYRQRKPCKTLTLFFHDILYNGHNALNATSAIVGAPEWGNRTLLAGQSHFGDVVVFDDPITLDNNLHSERVGRAQGMYLYDRKDWFTAWLAFTFALNHTSVGTGTLTFMGADPLMNKVRDVSVVGGTGDFAMARGVATIITDSYEGDVYFRLQLDIKLYECY